MVACRHLREVGRRIVSEDLRQAVITDEDLAVGDAGGRDARERLLEQGTIAPLGPMPLGVCAVDVTGDATRQPRHEQGYTRRTHHGEPRRDQHAVEAEHRPIPSVQESDEDDEPDGRGQECAQHARARTVSGEWLERPHPRAGDEDGSDAEAHQAETGGQRDGNRTASVQQRRPIGVAERYRSADDYRDDRERPGIARVQSRCSDRQGKRNKGGGRHGRHHAELHRAELAGSAAQRAVKHRRHAEVYHDHGSDDAGQHGCAAATHRPTRRHDARGEREAERQKREPRRWRHGNE